MTCLKTCKQSKQICNVHVKNVYIPTWATCYQYVQETGIIILRAEDLLQLLFLISVNRTSQSWALGHVLRQFFATAVCCFRYLDWKVTVTENLLKTTDWEVGPKVPGFVLEFSGVLHSVSGSYVVWNLKSILFAVPVHPLRLSSRVC